MSDQLNPEELLREFDQEHSQGAESANDVEVEIRGKKYKASQIEEWEKGFMRQEDYTRKTQALADEKRQQQASLQQLAELQKAIGVIQQRDPYLLAQAQRVVTGQSSQDPYAEDPYAQAIRQQQQQIQGIAAFQHELATKQNLIEIESELATLSKKYPKLDRNTVLSAIAADPDVDMESVARVSHDEMTQRVRAELQELAEQRKRQRGAMSEGAGGRTAGITKPVEIPKTREGMEKAVAERLKQLGGI
jgi:hypothetical protein